MIGIFDRMFDRTQYLPNKSCYLCHISEEIPVPIRTIVKFLPLRRHCVSSNLEIIMRTFLEQPEATFYHVTTIEKWVIIQANGLIPNNGRLFVSRVGELPILLAIAFEQLPEIYSTEEIIFLKLPQSKNNFMIDELKPDNQARVEWTQPFQNIILRQHIAIQNIELMMRLQLGQEPQRTFTINYLTRIANAGRENYQNHSITARALQLIY